MHRESVLITLGYPIATFWPSDWFFMLTPLRACLHGGGGPQVGEVTHLAVVEKWPAFTCKLTTLGSRGDITRRCFVVTRHVNRENDAFWRSVFFSSHYLLSLQHFSAVAFYCHFL